MGTYSKEWYREMEETSRRSATEVVPLVLELVKPESVVDVGCGTGAWLSVFKEFGITDILGIDGDCVEEEALLIPRDKFSTRNLEEPFKIERTFDLAVALEVAEHLPEERAKPFIDSLVRLAPAILFSAAVPFQGGVSHINEQWPDYWVKIFKDNDYLLIDPLRKKIWQNDKVSSRYAQNLLIFARRDCVEKNSLLKKEFENTRHSQISIIHPGQYLKVAKEINTDLISVRKAISVLPTLIKNAFARRIKKFRTKT